MTRLCCFALGLALTLTPPVDARAWDGAQTLTKSRTGQFVVAGNEQGRRAVAWSHGAGVFVRVAPRGGRFGRRLRIGAAGSAVQAAMDAHGDTTIVWTRFVGESPGRDPEEDGGQGCCVRLEGTVLRRDGRLSRRVQLGLPQAINGTPLLSASPGGRIAMAWETFDGSSNDIAVYARFGSARGGFGALRRVSPAGESGIPLSARAGRVVYATSRQTVESWRRADGSTGRRVLLDFPISRAQLATDYSGLQTGAWETGEIATRTPPGPFRTVARWVPGGAPAVSAAGAGAAAVAWFAPGRPARLMALVRPPGAGFGKALELDRVAADDATLVSSDSAPDGSAAIGVAYRRKREPDPLVQTRVYLAGPAGGSRERLIFPRADGARVQVLRDTNGTLAVAATTEAVVARWVRR